MNPNDPNVVMVEQVAAGLGTLLTETVFVGGAVTGFLITDPAQPAIRPTDDVDVLMEAHTRRSYNELEATLRGLEGFEHDMSEDAPICRWRYRGVSVDVMPTNPEPLGFANRWYPMAFDTARPLSLPSGLVIRLILPPVFLGTKIEAFRGRGRGDFRASRDLEDLVAVIDGRASIVEEVRVSPEELKAYLRENVSSFLANPDFAEALAGHLPPDAASQSRLPDLLATLRQLADEE